MKIITFFENDFEERSGDESMFVPRRGDFIISPSGQEVRVSKVVVGLEREYFNDVVIRIYTEA